LAGVCILVSIVVFSGSLLYDVDANDDDNVDDVDSDGCGDCVVVRKFWSLGSHRLNLEPNPGGTLEPRSESNLHDAVSLLQRIVPLVVVDVFELVPDGRGTGVSKIV